MEGTESNTIEVYQMRYRTNWEGPDSFYTWLLFSNLTQQWFGNVSFYINFANSRTLKLQFTKLNQIKKKKIKWSRGKWKRDNLAHRACCKM